MNHVHQKDRGIKIGNGASGGLPISYEIRPETGSKSGRSWLAIINAEINLVPGRSHNSVRTSIVCLESD